MRNTIRAVFTEYWKVIGLYFLRHTIGLKIEYRAIFPSNQK